LSLVTEKLAPFMRRFDELLRVLRGEGKPVFVHFTLARCITSKADERIAPGK
jgi:hypothetical protein